MATAGSAIRELCYVATSESVVAGGGSVAALAEEGVDIGWFGAGRAISFSKDE
jgi:hypothetical protein